MSERPDEFEFSPKRVRAPKYIRAKKRPAGTSGELAQYFCKTVPGITHDIKALAGSFKRWQDEGLSPKKIRAMIDLFAETNDPSTGWSAPAWRRFLFQREQLAAEIDNPAKKRERDDPIYRVGRRN